MKIGDGWRWRWRERERRKRWSEKERERTKRQRKWSKTKTPTQNTYALARTTLEIAVGRLSEQAFIAQEHARPTRNDGNSSSQVQQQRQHKTEKTDDNTGHNADFPPKHRGTTASVAATTHMWTFGATFVRWCCLVRFRGSSPFRSIYHEGYIDSRRNFFDHMIDIRRIAADFRDVIERIQTSSIRDSQVDNFSISESLLQRRFSVYSWNPGPQRGTEDASEN